MKLPNLEDLSLAQRVIIAIVIIVVVVLLLWLAVAAYPEPAAAEPTPPSPYDRHLLELDREALEAGYRQQLAHVYSIWMRDYHLGQSDRATTGFSNARRAYIQARHELERREQALNR